ncbi:MAG: peptidylprolyl isomerase, partial [Oscillospiraceae bacterium]|nr:peptidylprolyl isomerase [Oscillospiraceae bacterium]
SHIIDNEYSVNLWPFKGALAAYSQEQGVSDSRFIVIHEQERSEREREQLRELKVNGEDTLPEELLDALEEVGAAITLSGFYTIFGQAFEGFDVIEAITATEVDKESRPKTEIRIVTVEIEYYNENEGTSDEN